MKAFQNYLLNLFKDLPSNSKLILSLFVLYPRLAKAAEHKTMMMYLTENFVFEIIYGGGWYSFAIIITLSILSYFFKGFREVFLSIAIAICGIFLMMLLYEAYEDFRWIPEAAEDY